VTLDERYVRCKSRLSGGLEAQHYVWFAARWPLDDRQPLNEHHVERASPSRLAFGSRVKRMDFRLRRMQLRNNHDSSALGLPVMSSAADTPCGSSTCSLPVVRRVFALVAQSELRLIYHKAPVSESIPPALLARARSMAVEHERISEKLANSFDAGAAKKLGQYSPVISALRAWDDASEVRHFTPKMYLDC
jgi:hypothetical protein